MSLPSSSDDDISADHFEETGRLSNAGHRNERHGGHETALKCFFILFKQHLHD